MTRVGEQSLTTGDTFESPQAMALHLFALQVYATGQENPQAITDPSAWLQAADRMLDLMHKGYWQPGRIAARRKPKGERKKNLANLERTWNGLQHAHKELRKQIKDIAKLPEKAQKMQLENLYRNWVTDSAEKHGEVTGRELARPDWLAVRGMLTASSEHTVLQLEAAFERGRFEVVPESDYPMADISGRVGNQEITAHAELAPLPTEAGPDAKELMRKLAERMRDPLEALGPKTQQAMQYLLAAWLARRNADGWLVTHISQIAEALGYSRRPTGDYDADTYAAIRGFVDQLRRCQLRVRKMPELKGKTSRSNFEEPAFTFGFVAADEDIPHARGRPAQYWVSLRFRPNAYLSAIAARDGAFLMGADTAINTLDTQHQRTALLLGKYLERHFRFNWDRQPGVLTRRVGQLLTEGMGLNEQEASRPSIEKMRRLADNLDELERLGTVRDWEGDAAWADVRDTLELAPGRKRMTQRRWGQVLEARITIEAGYKYHEQYKHHGLTHHPDIDPLIIELRQYLASSGRPQKMIAADLGISPPQLSLLLRGKRRLTDPLRQKLDTLLLGERTLPLPFD